MPSKYRDPPPEAARAIPILKAYAVRAGIILLGKYGYTTADLLVSGVHYSGSRKGAPDFVDQGIYGICLGDAFSRKLAEELRSGFIEELREGKTAAWGRTARRFGSGLWRRIPARHWDNRWRHDIPNGIVKGPNITWYDVIVGERVAVSSAPPRRRPGASGRGIQWVKNEYHVRKAKELNKRTKAEEARELALRYADAHPNEKPITAKRIANWFSNRAEGRPLWDA